jgi:hypothetical protein
VKNNGHETYQAPQASSGQPAGQTLPQAQRRSFSDVGEAPQARPVTLTSSEPEGDAEDDVEDRLLGDLLDLDVSQIDTRRHPGAYANGGLNTPYDMSGLAGEYVAPPCGPSPLYNGRQPHYPIMHERLEHRVICHDKALGLSNKEIAERRGMSAVAISNILRQPWAQRMVLEIVHENGGDAVKQLLKSEALNSLDRLIVERDNPEARPSERIVAADKILDRLYGKPNQPIEHRATNLDTMSDEELERIARSSETSTATT